MAEGIKSKFNFLIGTTSYIIPADLLPNARYLADKVDDIQILLFESDEISSYPDENTVNELLKLKDEHELSYSVHLPVDAQLGSCDEEERQSSVEKIFRAWRVTRKLQPFAYVLHFEFFEEKFSPLNLENWLNCLDRSISQLVSAGMPAEKISVENLSYNFDYVEKIIEKHDLSVCIDTGHLLSNGYNLRDHILKWFSRCRVLHLQGSEKGKDHLDLSYMDTKVLKDIIALFNQDSEKERLVTLEIFSEEEFNISARILEDIT